MDTKNNRSLVSINRQVVSWTILCSLLFLRIPFLSGLTLLGEQIWLTPVYQIGTYLLTCCLIYWERKQLADFHIDRLALAIIILLKPIQTIILTIWKMQYDSLAFPKWPSLIIWFISLGLMIALLIDRPSLAKLSKNSYKWFGIGIMVGLFTELLLGYPGSFQVDKSQILSPSFLFVSIKEIPLLFLYQLGYAAVSEEPLFRGFLWGYLQKAGWKSVWIWLFQAVLFSIGHIYYLKRFPISFWIIVPVGALVLGGLVWRSKTISSSLAAHATLNALGNVVWRIIASLRM